MFNNRNHGFYVQSKFVQRRKPQNDKKTLFKSDRVGSFGKAPGTIQRECWSGNGAIELVDFFDRSLNYRLLSRVISKLTVAASGFNCCPSLPILFLFCTGCLARNARRYWCWQLCFVGYRPFQTTGLKNSGSSNEINNQEVLLCFLFQSTDLFVMASNSFQQAKSIFEVVNNVHNEVSSRPKKTGLI